jgi:hypothetical protein
VLSFEWCFLQADKQKKHIFRNIQWQDTSKVSVRAKHQLETRAFQTRLRRQTGKVVTQEFHISVTPVGQNDYLVRTEQVAPGVPLAEELVRWPVAEWLAAAGQLMNDPLKSVLQGDALARNSVNLVALGQQLYNALFQGTLRDSWITAQGIAQNHQQVLRLRLGLKDTKLARLPWEVMHASDHPIATGNHIAFSRYQSGNSRGSRLPSTSMPISAEEGGIKVLMVIASPTDLVRLDLLKQEAIKLQHELHRHSEGGYHLPEIQLTLLEQPGREELTQALEQGRYHVLHYSGHSNLGSKGGEIYLVSNRTGLKETLSGDDLAGLLVNNSIQMAVFNSCLGAYAATSEAGVDTGERNLTESLVKRGIKSVLAMSERIPDEVALLLTQLFYRNLSQGLPVDLCVSRMRQGLIAAYGSHQMYWALPTLYLQPEFDGYLCPEIYLSQSGELYNEYDPNLRAAPRIYSAAADDADLPLPIEEMISSSLVRNPSNSLDWLGEDTWGDLVDEIEYDDPSYAQDSAFVSDLFRQLDSQAAETEHSSMTAELIQDYEENSFQNRQVIGEITSLEDDTQTWEEVQAAAAYGRHKSASHQNLPSLQEASSMQTGNFEVGWDDLDYPLSAETHVVPSQHTNSRQNGKNMLLRVVSVVGASVVAVAFGLNWWQNQQPLPMAEINKTPTTQRQANQTSPQINLKTDQTGTLTVYATEQITQGNLPQALLVVEELLNRNALPNAQATLALVPQEHASNPYVNFLKGRLAWQFVQAGDLRYTLDDARRYWEIAAQAKPDFPLYKNALGFAYYAKGELLRANDSWFKALSVAVKDQNTPTNTSVVTTEPPKPQDALTAYAGLALGLYKTAGTQPPAKREQYLNEAIKLRQMVVKDDPVSFQVDELHKNWLWNQKTRQDWQALLELKGQTTSAVRYVDY